MNTEVHSSNTREDYEHLGFRLLYMILFFVVLRICGFLLFLTAVVQFMIRLFTGSNHSGVKDFGDSLSQYIYANSRFLSFQTEKKPFPFSEWPSPDTGEQEVIDNKDHGESKPE